MTTEQVYNILTNKQKRNFFVIACLLLMAFTTIVLDIVYANFHNSSFYLSESLLFTTFWLWFFPILTTQLKLTRQNSSLWVSILIIILATCVHLIAYPAFVWLLSYLFYSHTFSYWQTFNFGLTEHIIKAVLIYSLPHIIYSFLKNRSQTEPSLLQEIFLSSILVSDSNNKKITIATTDIIYFYANPPYINIHHKTKKYLLAKTLKSLEAQLDNKQFIRIHKSFIVNIEYVISCQSRLNGDYDLTLSDNTVLRLSRNFASGFKSRFINGHQVTSK